MVLLVVFSHSTLFLFCIFFVGLRGGRYSSDNMYGPMICDTEMVLSKGSHKLSFKHYGRGSSTQILGGSTSSIVLVEELLHD